MQVGIASPPLMKAVATGEIIKTAVLSARVSGAAEPLLVITLTNVVATSFEISGNTTAPPVEQVALHFEQIVLQYRQQMPDGRFAAPIQAGWDRQANKAI